MTEEKPEPGGDDTTEGREPDDESHALGGGPLRNDASSSGPYDADADDYREDTETYDEKLSLVYDAKGPTEGDEASGEAEADAETDDSELELDRHDPEVEASGGDALELDREAFASDDVREEDEETPAQPKETRVREPVSVALAIALVGLVLLGSLLRGGLYWRDRAVWHDEINLGIQLVERSLPQLFEPLGESHSAPLGFVVLVKIVIDLWGDHEFALRLVPLVASILVLPLLVLLARRTTGLPAAAYALGIMAFAMPQLRYATELKQYSMDALVATIVAIAGMRVLQGGLSGRGAIGFGLLGAVALWFSHPAVFVLAGVGLVLGGDALRMRDRSQVLYLLGAGAAWAVSFGANYWFFLRPSADDATLHSWHFDSFMTFPPVVPWPTAIKHYLWEFIGMFSGPLGLVLPGLGALAFVLGVFVLWRQNRAALLVLLAPIVPATIASALMQYPFAERFLLFFSPMVVLVTGLGVHALVTQTGGFRRVIGPAFLVLLYLQPAFVAVNEIRKPPNEGARPIVDYLKMNYEAGDEIYVYYWLRNEFAYYGRLQEFEPPHTIGWTSRRDWSFYRDEMEALAGHERVWFAFVKREPHLQQGERQFFETTLDTMGTQLDHQTWRDHDLYLYDLSGAGARDTVDDTEESAVESPENAVIESATVQSADDSEPSVQVNDP